MEKDLLTRRNDYYADMNHALGFLPLALQDHEVLAILECFMNLYGDANFNTFCGGTNYSTTAWALEFEILTQMLIKHYALLVNPLYINVNAALPQLKDIMNQEAYDAYAEAQSLTQTDINAIYFKSNGFDKQLCGGYAWLPTYADNVEDSDEDALIMRVAIKDDLLKQYLQRHNLGDLKGFLTRADIDDVWNAYQELTETNAIAFTWCLERDRQFIFYNMNTAGAMNAFIDAVSNHLQKNGFEEASKYLDAMFDL